MATLHLTETHLKLVLSSHTKRYYTGRIYCINSNGDKKNF